MSDRANLRDALLREVSGLRQENEARIASPQFTSNSGYNIAAWAEKGYEKAMIVIAVNAPDGKETVAEYAARLTGLLETEQAAFVDDDADEDGGAAGALTDAILALDRLAP